MTAYGVVIKYPWVSLVLLVFPIVYCIIIWLILRHDTMVYTLADYLFTILRPKVNRLLQLPDSDSVWLWEQFRYRQHLESGTRKAIFHRFLAFFRYGVPFLLSIVSVLLFVQIKYSNRIYFDSADISILCLNAAVIIFTSILMLSWVTRRPSFTESSAAKEHDGQKRQSTIQ